LRELEKYSFNPSGTLSYLARIQAHMIHPFFIIIIAYLAIYYSVTVTIYVTPLIIAGHGLALGISAWCALMSPVIGVWYRIQLDREKKHRELLEKPFCDPRLEPWIDDVERRARGRANA
jgi:hypothetical protein